MTMESRALNPTPWLQAFNLNHAIEVSGVQRTLYLSGQTATAADGTAMHPGDFVAQFQAAWDNLKDALAASGMAPSNVVRLNMYTTDVDAFMAAAGDLVSIFASDGVQPVSTLLGVNRLYDPAILIELEATAVA
jgi:enamine deaminase RidA (YjgF/YER057c/UK114 family)